MSSLTKKAVLAEFKKVSFWVKSALLLAVNYTADILVAVHEHLPELQPYLPDNIFKAMGIAVVIASILRSVAAGRKGLKQ
jgi:hypothetical protein